MVRIFIPHSPPTSALELVGAPPQLRESPSSRAPRGRPVRAPTWGSLRLSWSFRSPLCKGGLGDAAHGTIQGLLIHPPPGALVWPAAMIVWGPGFTSAPHRHHSVQLVMAMRGTLLVRVKAGGAWQRSWGVVV